MPPAGVNRCVASSAWSAAARVVALLGKPLRALACVTLLVSRMRRLCARHRVGFMRHGARRVRCCRLARCRVLRPSLLLRARKSVLARLMLARLVRDRVMRLLVGDRLVRDGRVCRRLVRGGSLRDRVHTMRGRRVTGRYGPRAMKNARLPGRRDRRRTVIDGGMQASVSRGQVLVAQLCLRHAHVMLVRRAQFLASRPCDDTTRSAIEGDAIDRYLVDHGVVHDEGTALPVATVVAVAVVAASIVDAAVEPDVESPVAGMPEIRAAGPTPVARGPKEADRRWQHPGSRNVGRMPLNTS